MRRASEATKEKFIVAAIRELNESGISGFSVRHIAEICGVSYGAPYKHYKGKHDLLRAVIDYVNKPVSYTHLDVYKRQPLNIGDVVKGVITSVFQNEIHVDIGGKLTGILPFDNVTDDPTVDIPCLLYTSRCV